MKIITLQQGTLEWLEWRKGGIGGSDIATILGLSPFEDATRENLLREKTERWQRTRNFAMRRGTRLEPIARRAYETAYRTDAPPVCIQHDSVPWGRGSLDGLCRHRFDAGHGKPWILELKAPAWETHSAALAGIVPDYYRVQCQYQLWVAGIDLCHFASYTEHTRFKEKDRLAVVPVRENAEEQARILEAAEAFWAEVCQRRELAAVA